MKDLYVTYHNIMFLYTKSHLKYKKIERLDQGLGHTAKGIDGVRSV